MAGWRCVTCSPTTWNYSVTERVTRGVQSHKSPRIAADHGRHDRLLVTRFAGGDAYPTEVEDARALVEACAQCAALAADIRGLITATAALPASRRRRDFRITQEQAEALRGSWLERLLRRLAAPSLAPLRPVAAVALSLGIVMAAAGTALPSAAPASAPASEPMSAEDMGRLVETPGAATPAAAEAPGAPAEDEDPAVPDRAYEPSRVGDGVASEPDEEAPQATAQPDDTPEPAYGLDAAQDGGERERSQLMTTSGNDGAVRSILFYGGGLLAMAGLAFLLATVIARRATRDPLLR